MIIGIVGSEAAKFTLDTEAKARSIIKDLLSQRNVTGMSSGHCHLGGIDIFAEEIASELGIAKYIYPPKEQSWEKGYKPRNIQIALKSDEVYCITVDKLPDTYKGMKFSTCYHCNSNSHVKSGGCWTVKYAKKIGKKVGVIVIESQA